MNLGGDAADQVVRYSLEGIDYSLRLSGTLAKNMAVFFVAVLKDQKKTRGKTRLVRMLKENRPVKFFTIPQERMKEFATMARNRGLLYVVIRDKQNPDKCEVMAFADDAAKVNRIMDNMGLDFLKSESGQAVTEVVGKQEETPETFTQTVTMPEGEVQFEIDESDMDFGFEEPEPQVDIENFIQVQEGTEKNPSEPFLHNSDTFTEDEKTEPESKDMSVEHKDTSREADKKPSVRAELEKIKQEKQEAEKKPAVNRSRSSNRSSKRKKKKSKTKGR